MTLNNLTESLASLRRVFNELCSAHCNMLDLRVVEQAINKIEAEIEIAEARLAAAPTVMTRRGT